MKIDGLNIREIRIINKEILELKEKRESEINSALEKAVNALPDARDCKHERYQIPVMKSNFLIRKNPKTIYDIIFTSDKIVFTFRKVKVEFSEYWELESYE